MKAVFLQVRLDSSRLPRKALADLGGRPLVARCFEALNLVEADCRVLVTEAGSAPDLEPWARAAGWEVFVGSKDDVLDRFVQAARHFGADLVVRATGDNPLVSPRLANLLADRAAEGWDYQGFEGLPVGTGVEVVRAEALERAWASVPDPYEREHVCPHLYRRPGAFRVSRPPAPPGALFPQGRVTVDTAEDLAAVRALWAELYRGTPLEPEDFIPWLKCNPR